MNFLKALFPVSFKFTGSIANIIVGILIYLIVGIIGGVIIALTSFIPFVPFLGFLCGLLGTIVDIYVVGGIVVLFLAHFNVLK